MLTAQLLYFISFIPRVWVDTGILPKTVTAVYLTNIINFSIFAYCGYRAFVFLGLYENAPGFRLWGSRFWYSIPFLFNIVMVLSCPVTGVYFTVLPDATVGSGALWKLMVVINCFYPTMGLLSYFIRRKDEETADLKAAVIFPLFFIIFGPLSSLQWRIPILPFGLMLADLFVYVYYTDLLMGQRNQALENEKIAAERANTAKSEFLASMSHEIRTPINAVLGMNEMIIRESRDDRITLYARNVESAGKNLLAIINDILDFSKIEAGKMEITEGDYKLSSVLNDVTNMIASKARTKDLKLDVDVDETLPDELRGDEVRVRQVITNILNNAVKYTHEGGVTFQTSGESKSSGDLNLIIRVKDTGIGIKAEDLPKLFNKFERVDLAQNSTVEGTGLGLSITQNLLKLMGGEIQVESEYGKGSTFTLHIPQKVVNDEPIGDFQEKFKQYVHEIKAYRESFKAPTARILVVDDTEMNLTVVKGLLSQTEVQMDTALSGAEALALTKDLIPEWD